MTRRVVFGAFPLQTEDGTFASAPVFATGENVTKDVVATAALPAALAYAKEHTGFDFSLACGEQAPASFLHEYSLEETLEKLVAAFGAGAVLGAAVVASGIAGKPEPEGL